MIGIAWSVDGAVWAAHAAVAIMRAPGEAREPWPDLWAKAVSTTGFTIAPRTALVPWQVNTAATATAAWRVARRVWDLHPRPIDCKRAARWIESGDLALSRWAWEWAAERQRGERCVYRVMSTAACGTCYAAVIASDMALRLAPTTAPDPLDMHLEGLLPSDWRSR